MGNSLSSDVGYNSTTANATSNLHTIINATNGLETYSKNPLQNAIEAAIAADIIPVNELIADWKNHRDKHDKAIGILRGTSGITSLISSSIFIWMIMRSHDRLSTTQHRLLLGLCISDILFSLSHSTFNATVPSDIDYKVWNAKGNQDTCDTQGFILALGACSGLFYNASLNLYFLALVKYKKSDEFIRAKIEPFLHGLPIAVAINYSIYLLVREHYNDDGGGACIFPTNNAPHCKGYDVGKIREHFEIPCWRGHDGFWAAYISTIVLMFIPVLIMIVSLGMIYNSVRTQEKKLAKYGVGALRSNLHQQQSDSTAQSSGMWGRISMSLTALSTSLKAGKWSCKKSNKHVTRSNNVQSQSRAVMHKAFGYTFAWFLSYGCYLTGFITQMATGSFSFPLALNYLASIFGPLQGLFNLLIFMHPKIVAAKKSKRQGGGTVSWCKAFSTAFWSKGKGGRNQGTSRSNLRGCSNRPLRNTRNEDAASDIVAPPMFGEIKKEKKTKRTDTTQEEEKCEIQVPDNLNPDITRAMYSTACPATYAPNIVPSTDSTTMRTAADFEVNVNVGNALSNILEGRDEVSMLDQDEEEKMNEAEEGNVEIESMAADVLVSAEEKEIALDDDSKLARMNTNTVTDGLKEEEEKNKATPMSEVGLAMTRQQKCK